MGARLPCSFDFKIYYIILQLKYNKYINHKHKARTTDKFKTFIITTVQVHQISNQL